MCLLGTQCYQMPVKRTLCCFASCRGINTLLCCHLSKHTHIQEQHILSWRAGIALRFILFLLIVYRLELLRSTLTMAGSKGKGKAVGPPKDSKAVRCDRIKAEINALETQLDKQKTRCDAIYNRYVGAVEKYGTHSAKPYGNDLRYAYDERDRISKRIQDKNNEYQAVYYERDSSSDGSHRSRSSERSRRSGSSQSSAPPFVGWACGVCGNMIYGDPDDGFHNQCGTPGCGHEYCTVEVVREEYVGTSHGRRQYRRVRGQHCAPQFNPSAERPQR